MTFQTSTSPQSASPNMNVNLLLARRFDGWMENLLDLSKRNRLIHFKPQANTTIKLIEPDLPEIWKRLVLRNKALSFYGLEAEADLFDEEEGDIGVVPQRALRPDELQSDTSSTRLGKTLLYLRQRARTSLEEQGIVTLFVAFGFLRWNEADASGKAGDDIFSPLLLVPVSLQRESSRKPYTLRLWEEEVVLNPALKFCLAREAKIELPEPGETDELDLTRYFAQVAQAIRAQPNWTVLETAYLGLFAFHKIAMYRDLGDNRDAALSHGLVRALAGQSDALPDVPPDLPSGAALDEIAPRDMWQIVDADSSQQEAIAAARRGVSFVLQGPPGTGKSQTITNIIAECLAAGKKVLFVSEKMAALQVVHTRLAQSGLRDFCLEAHSHKANKREVIQELDRTLKVARPTLLPAPDDAEKLATLRNDLNLYAHELHQIREPLHLSFHEVAGRFSALHDAPQLLFSFENADQVAPAQREQIADCLREMARLHRVLDLHETYPWRGATMTECDLQTRERIGARFSRLASSLRQVDAALHAVLEMLNLTRFVSLAMAHRVLDLAETLLQTPFPPREWLQESDLTSRQNALAQWQPRFENFNARRDALVVHRDADFLNLSHSELRERLTTRHQNSLERIAQNANSAARDVISNGENALRVRDDLLPLLQQNIVLFEQLQSAQNALNHSLQTDSSAGLNGALHLQTLASLATRASRPQMFWFENERNAALQQAAQTAQNNEAQIAAAQKMLSSLDIDALSNLELDQFLARFEGEYASAEKQLTDELQPELQRLATFANDGAIFTFERAVADLQLAKNAWHQQKWLDENSDELRQLFPTFNGFKTDWIRARDEVVALIETAREHQNALSRARESLADYNFAQLLALDHRALIAAIDKDAVSFWRFLKPSFQNAIKAVAATRDSATRVSTVAPTVAPTFAQTVADLEIAATAAQHDKWLREKAGVHAQQFGAHFQNHETDWQNLIRHVEAKAEEAQAQTLVFQNVAEQLPAFNLAALLRKNVPEWRQLLIDNFSAPVRVLDVEMARDVASLQKLHREATTRSRTAWLDNLKTARDLRERIAWRAAQSAVHERDFSTHYSGALTDWTGLLTALQSCRDIAQFHGDKSVENLKKALCDNVEPENIVGQSARLKTILISLQNASKALHAIFPLHTFPFGTASLVNAPLPDLIAFLRDSYASLLDFYESANVVRAGETTLQSALDDLAEAAVIERESGELAAWKAQGEMFFGPLFKGVQTDWIEIAHALNWSHRVLDWFTSNALSDQTVAVATEKPARDALCDVVEKLRQSLQTFNGDANDDWVFAQSIFPDLQIQARPGANVSLYDAASCFEERVARLGEVDDWLAWQRLETSSTRCGLSDFWRASLHEKPAVSQIESVFWRRFWALWLDQTQKNVPYLARFTGEVHDDEIARFRVLDVAVLGSVRSRLAAILAQDRPRSGVMRAGEVALLQKEALKKTRHKALRTIFGEIPHVLQALKPCLLMSPLSVAQFLQPDKVRFDLVIFDEASQICSEDAIGAIMRGTQLIVVGDRKQLPPSRFFGGTSYDEDDEESEGSEVYESILDECATMGLPDKMLLWHYRSRNEELIAFSNRHFYESNLITFPGPHAVGSGTRGVSFEKVDGFYIRGKAKDARTNPIEARRVAQLVIEHFERNAHESLGVIAFNEAQMRAIAAEVQRLASNVPRLDALVNAEGPDAFFIKNLENVQGDERDVILFSVGYGPSEDGKFSMNFGPLNRAGGERRLNVAVTRARLRVRIVASFEPEEIRQERTSAQGPKLLAQYLSFAKNGGLWDGATIVKNEDGVEESVV